MCGSGKGTVDLSPVLKNHFPYKVVPMLCPFSFFTRLQDPVFIWIGSLSFTYILFHVRLILCVSRTQILNKILTLQFHTYPGIQPQFYREHVGPEWVELSSPWTFRANWWHGNGMLHIEKCVTPANSEMRGACWPAGGKISPSHLKLWTMGSLSDGLKVSLYQSKGCSIRCVVHLDVKYIFHN